MKYSKVGLIGLIILFCVLLTGCGEGEMYEKAMEQARLAEANGEYDKAVASYNLALEEEPDDADATTRLVHVTQMIELIEAFEANEMKRTDTLIAKILSQPDLAPNMKQTVVSYRSKVKQRLEDEEEIKKQIALIKTSIDGGMFDEASKIIGRLQSDSKFSESLVVYMGEINELNQTIAAELEKQKMMKDKRTSLLLKMEKIEDSLSDLEYLSSSGITSDLVQARSMEYARWDDALNEIWTELKKDLSKEEMQELTTAQRKWLRSRDENARAASDEYGMGSFATVAYNDTLAQMTKERCYELIRTYY